MYEECKSMDDTYLPMQSIGTVKEPTEQVSDQITTTRNAIYSNATPTGNATPTSNGRSNGIAARQRQSPETNLEETEERYIIVVH